MQASRDNIICPFCDSAEIETFTAESRFPIPFCDDFVLRHPQERCRTCQEEGSFADSSDDSVERALVEANAASAASLIGDLEQCGITAVYFEKALGLPFGTLKHWRYGEISSAGLALLRLIRYSPELLAVADGGYRSGAGKM